MPYQDQQLCCSGVVFKHESRNMWWRRYFYPFHHRQDKAEARILTPDNTVGTQTHSGMHKQWVCDSDVQTL